MQDLVVIGAGPGGYVAAIKAAQLGLSVTLIEKGDVGGTCLNRGCIPTKTLLRIAHLYHELQNAESLGLSVEGLGFDMSKIHAKKQAVVEQLQTGIEGLVKANGITSIKGEATIIDPNTVRVGDETIKAKHLLIATGAMPALPPITGIDLPGVVTSDDLLETGHDPIETPGRSSSDELLGQASSITIIGGGVIGVEMASIYANLGAHVNIIEAADRLLPQLDKELGQSLALSLKKKGVTVHLGATVSEIIKSDNLVTYFTDKKGEACTTLTQKVLVATGRKATITGLLADGFSLDFDRGLVVNDNFQTNVPNIYAIGDCVAGSIQLAHTASAEGVWVAQHIAGVPTTPRLDLVPACIYTDPEIATVGLSEAAAKEKGLAVKTAKYLMSGHGKSVLEDQDRGFIKLVFREDSNVLVGAQLMCGRATDIVSQLTLAIGTTLDAATIASFIQPHPSFSEGVTEAAEVLFGHAIHVAPPRKRA